MIIARYSSDHEDFPQLLLYLCIYQYTVSIMGMWQLTHVLDRTRLPISLTSKLYLTMHLVIFLCHSTSDPIEEQQLEVEALEAMFPDELAGVCYAGGSPSPATHRRPPTPPPLHRLPCTSPPSDPRGR